MRDAGTGGRLSFSSSPPRSSHEVWVPPFVSLPTPNGGLGLNCGVHDAINLTGKIHDVWHGRAGMDVFDRYTRQRKTIATDYVHRMSDANHHRMRERGPSAAERLERGLAERA